MRDIEGLVQDLIQTYHSRDPEELIRCLDIHLYERTDFQQLLGMYMEVEGRKCIFLKADLEEAERNMILAHELGHALLHREEAAMMEIMNMTFFSMTEKPEYEANVFAAHLLIPAEEVEALQEEDLDVVTMAKALRVNVSLLLIKLHEMKRKGYRISLDRLPRADFLGHLPD